jgi:hypothetical protein
MICQHQIYRVDILKYLYSKFNMMIKLKDFDVSLLCELANKITNKVILDTLLAQHVYH